MERLLIPGSAHPGEAFKHLHESKINPEPDEPGRDLPRQGEKVV